jgi:hypothetical protein
MQLCNSRAGMFAVPFQLSDNLLLLLLLLLLVQQELHSAFGEVPGVLLILLGAYR